jgi:predicted transcriptional regulator
MSNRELVIDVLNKLPEDAPIEEILEKIEFVAGIKEGLEQSERGEGVSPEEARRLMREWISKSSRSRVHPKI